MQSRQNDHESEPHRKMNFPIVGIGASAGGLEALTEFFASLQPDTGMGFVVVTHQHPGHMSLLPELIGKPSIRMVSFFWVRRKASMTLTTISSPTTENGKSTAAGKTPCRTEPWPSFGSLPRARLSFRQPKRQLPHTDSIREREPFSKSCYCRSSLRRV